MTKHALRYFVALAAGLLFGAGLAVSQMINPEKVLDFFDFAGRWDPSLAMTLGGALFVTVLTFGPARTKASRAGGQPLLDAVYALPTKNDIDAPLVGGAALFGVGWGLVGFCVGPAIAAIAFGEPKVYIFIAAMLVGSALTKFVQSRPINTFKKT